MHWLLNKLGMKDNKALIGYLTVVTAGQLIYSGFEAFKGSFYNTLLQVLHLSNAQLGAVFSLIGISMFFYIPGGWINNRFSIRSILITGLLIRFVTMTYIILFAPGFETLKVIAVIWGLTDAFFWPAVLNGVIFFTDKQHRGLGFGLLEAIHRLEEVVMSLLVVAVMALISGLVVFKGAMFTYNLLILPMIFLIWKYIPKNGISAEKIEHEHLGEKSLDALKGLFYVLIQPKVWLAAIAAMSIYWGYIILVYSVPYLQNQYHLSTAQTAVFGVLNTGFVGVLAGVITGVISDYVFKSTTKMIFVALFLSSIVLLIVVFFKTGLVLSMILLFTFSLTTFLSKSVILAPISEFKLPEKYSGSAMSVGSFMAYAPIFWVYTMNGQLLDEFKGHEFEAYQMIFKIGIAVSAAGSLAALILVILMNKEKRKERLKAAQS
ncbi:MFS transporter [Staphylococcus simulans]|uniref:MFS transporter n=1 Tax=Staphylococcus simulans TaxID=1286 RepID=UPI000D02EC25|nr:MFS transporter [Staphylococcus simulans]